ncbi:MAG TPA: amidohydrolase family protein [Candidatus Acidoferrales bacterium]|nr:amidohydrolase family protein [Candidatus Acidoferrales bacterium]
MPIIDADTHVDETEDTWSYLQPGEEALRPETAYPKEQDPSRPPMRYWVIDGRRHLRFVRSDEQTKTTVQTRELLDVDARLRDLDRMGVDIQVIYPTLFLVEVTERADVELALRRSYNRWLAERCARSRGRLRWVMLPPVRTMDKALEELRFAKDQGACGVLKKGDREAGFWPADPYFFPLYEQAERLDLPICFHTGAGTPDSSPARLFPLSGFYRITLPVVHAFQSLIAQGVPARFPRLRFGFIEAAASWIPFVYHNLRRHLAKNRERPASVLRGADQLLELSEDIMRSNRMYVTCQVDEDLPYLLKYAGEDNLLLGSDYSHADPAQEINFTRRLQARADAGEIPPSAVKKIIETNPGAFYGL